MVELPPLTEPMQTEGRRPPTDGAIHRLRVHRSRVSPYTSPNTSPKAQRPNVSNTPAEGPDDQMVKLPQCKTDCAICQDTFTDPCVGGGW